MGGVVHDDKLLDHLTRCHAAKEEVRQPDLVGAARTDQWLPFIDRDLSAPPTPKRL
jgi:2-methylisocitrate lyase-like PEP mutase family enzyme